MRDSDAHFAVVAREVFHFERTHATTALCVALAIALDLVAGRLLYGEARFPLTPVIIGLACSLLMNARATGVNERIAACSIMSQRPLLTLPMRAAWKMAYWAITLACSNMNS